MLYENTSQDVKTEFRPLQDVFVISSREEISMSEILERWFLSFRGKPFKKPFFAIPNLSPILQIDYSSSIYPFIGPRSETAVFKDFIKKTEKERALKNISRIIDELINKEKLFEEIDKAKVLNAISETLNEISLEQMEISKEELSKRIEGVLVLEVVSGMLNELTPDQIKDFDEAVKRRPLFK